MSINLRTLISKLDDTCRVAAERAASICMSRGNHEMEIEHLLLALLEQPRSDFVVVARRSGISVDALQRDLENEVGKLRTGSTRTPVFAQSVAQLLENAWLIASLDTQASKMRSGHVLLALLTAPQLVQMTARSSALFAQFRCEELKHDFEALTRGSREALDHEGAVAASGRNDVDRPPAQEGAMRRQEALERYTTSLTERARAGALDPVVGRDAEIRQLIDILMRRRQNNPILTGEAGVGKTAVVEGLALKIVAGDVPEVLRDVALHVLDMGLLQAGASVRGEFEARLKGVIDDVRSSPRPIVLFIDEAHALIGAGGAAGQHDAANLLKPALARGELRTIAATTWSEYKKYFEKDAALARRFQVVKVEEPDEMLAAAMLRGMVGLMEQHFDLRVLDEAVTEAVRLSHRYISGRQLPDKAVSVLDTACAKVALGRSATPALIEDTQRNIERLQAEMAALQRDGAEGNSGGEARLPVLQDLQAKAEATLRDSQARLLEEQSLAARISGLLGSLKASGDITDRAQRLAELAALRSELRLLQADGPLVPVVVDGAVVAEVVSGWTGIPLGKVVSNERETLGALDRLMKERIVGQDHALDVIAQRVRTAAAALEDPDKPRGVFLFVGPSGVGKTETALALADILYGGERRLITINMCEYQEAHSVSGLRGAPPGYVGYGEGGVLTESVRRTPYCVLLLDEVEKAHPDVLEMFYQVFDRGEMEDAEGRRIDFRNTLIIMTCNAGSALIMKSCSGDGAGAMPSPDTLVDALRPTLVQHFRPAFVGRLQIVPYLPLGPDMLARIIGLKLQRIGRRLMDSHKARLSWTPSLVDALARRCTDADSGARNIDSILNGSLLPDLAGRVLNEVSNGRRITRIRLRASKAGDIRMAVS